jgi:hypothetical protein
MKKNILITLVLFPYLITAQCLSGNCKNGFGKKNYEGDYYVGTFVNGERHGKGDFYLENGNISFRGIWHNDSAFEGLDFDTKGKESGIYISGILIESSKVASDVFTNLLLEFKNEKEKLLINEIRKKIVQGFDDQYINNYYSVWETYHRTINERASSEQRKINLKNAITAKNYIEISQLITQEELNNLEFEYLIELKDLNDNRITESLLYSKLNQYNQYERFLKIFPSYKLQIENKIYNDLENRALNKNWCSYCCEIYLKLFKNNVEKRTEVIEWRRFAYNAEVAEQNAKTASENAKAISEANHKAKQNEPKVCTTCGGRGVCLKCNGKGYTACDYHDTNNDGHCTTCNDRGILNCGTCDNKGTCNTCGGKGKIF